MSSCPGQVSTVVIYCHSSSFVLFIVSVAASSGHCVRVPNSIEQISAISGRRIPTDPQGLLSVTKKVALFANCEYNLNMLKPQDVVIVLKLAAKMRRVCHGIALWLKSFYEFIRSSCRV